MFKGFATLGHCDLEYWSRTTNFANLKVLFYWNIQFYYHRHTGSGDDLENVTCSQLHAAQRQTNDDYYRAPRTFGIDGLKAGNY